MALWTDDFNSATALSSDYTITGTINKVAGIGPDGSQAIRSNTQLGGEWLKQVSANASRYFCVSIQSKPTHATNFGIFVLELRYTAGVFISLYIGGGPNDSNTRVTAINRHGDNEYSATGVIDPTSWQEIQLSGFASSSPGVADGSATVKVDGTTVLTITNWRISALTSVVWNQVAGYPQGDADDLNIANTCDSADTDSPLDENTSTNCCGASPETTEGAAGPLLPATSPLWTIACAGSGEVPSASTPSDAEDWDQ